MDCASFPNRFLLIPVLIPLIFFPHVLLSLSFDYPSLGDSQRLDMIYNGSVSFTPDYVELTYDPQSSVGRLYSINELFLWDSATQQATSFNCSFEFAVARTTPNTTPADGLTFFLIDSSQSAIPDNATGYWLGLLNATTNGTASAGVVAVEFDTFQDPFDPNDNHIGVDINTIVSASAYPDLSFRFIDSTSVFAWVVYSSSLSLLEVYANNVSSTKPGSPLLSYPINLTQLLPQWVVVGFSASTGEDSEYHRIFSWSFNSIPSTIVNPPHKPNVGLIAGPIATGMLIIIAVIVLLRLRFRWHAQRKHQELDRPLPDVKGLPSSSDGGFGPHKFTFKELSGATNNFAAERLLGKGGFGPVYKGLLPQDKSQVAVKCISQKSSQGEKEFFAEVSIISRIRHRNLVQLRGWCREKGNLLLVYEYLPKGSLDQYLHTEAPPFFLEWETRYNIVCGLGSAIQYLHQECEKAIVHRDVKPSNVILDANYNAKLGDFGLARQLGEGMDAHTTLAAGTVGYIAPESYETVRATPESDVYSYGIVLLEVACGRRPVDTSLPSQFEGRLLDWVWDLHSKGKLKEAADSRLGHAIDEQQLIRTLTVALACVHPDPKARPSIRQALEALEGRVPLPSIPAFKPVAYYGLAPRSLFTTTLNSSSYDRISTSSSAPDSDMSEHVPLHNSA